MCGTATRVTGLQVFADLRGNHDTFNVPQRGGPADRYLTHGWSLPDLATARVAVRDVTNDEGACLPSPILPLPSMFNLR